LLSRSLRSLHASQPGTTRILAPLLIVAAAIRIAVNNVVEFSRADETIYMLYTKALAAGSGYPYIIRVFVDDRGMWVLPNPLRWSYLGATTLFASILGEPAYETLATLSTVAGIAAVILAYWIAGELFGSNVALIATAIVATSPLQLALGRRALADEFYCALVLASIASLILYLRDAKTLWLIAWIVTTTLTFAAKEQFLFIYPVVLLYWWLTTRRVTFTTLAQWALPPFLFFAVFCLLARDVTSFFRIAHIITSAMTAPYAAAYQSGPPQRLIIDSLAVAPIITMLAIAAIAIIALRRDAFTPAHRYLAVLVGGFIAVHAILPSQNLRYIVCADPLLRILVAAFIAIELRDRTRVVITLLVINAAVELALFHRIFITGGVYDPVTQNLLRALRMVP
jgi:4-amino-4-deoxy-L-arabinose transferase-like glycosyltransferase